MSKVILFNLMTLDGQFEGQNRDISWHNVDEEFNEFAIDQLAKAGGLVFGRDTYELMAGFWPTPQAADENAIIAGWMNRLPKYVFSTSMSKADWDNTTLLNGNAAQELVKIKQESSRDVYIFGSARLAETFFRHDLIDEVRILVNPLILGRGTPLFKPGQTIPLRLLTVRSFNNGNVLLIYAVRNSLEKN